MTARLLSAKMLAFIDAYAGPGTHVEAARKAGYLGAKMSASQLLRDPRVRTALLARGWRIDDPPHPATPPAATQTPTAAGVLPTTAAGSDPTERLREGRGRGTYTERVKLAMRIARDESLPTKDRLAAIKLAAELEGEIKSRARVTPPQASVVVTPDAQDQSPADEAPKRPVFKLFVSPDDARVAGGGGE